MGLFKTKNEKEILKAKKFFFENITDESKKEYEDIYDRINTNLESVYDQGWAADMSYNLYKEGTNAYLLLSDEGYQIDPNAEQKNIELLRENKFLLDNKTILNELFKAILDEKEFNNGKWDTKYGANIEEVRNAALKAGFLQADEILNKVK